MSLPPPPTSTARIFLVVLLAALVVASCDTTATQTTSQVVVTAYLQAGTPVGSVRLTRPSKVGEAYARTDAAVDNANVTIRRLTKGGSPSERIAFDETSPGVYSPVSPPTVQPRTTYELLISTPQGDRVTATTTVPDTISIVQVENQQAVYQGAAQPTFLFTAPRTEENRRPVFVLTTTSLLDFKNTPGKTLREHLTPPYASLSDEEDPNFARVTSTGLLNEGNFDRTPAGTLKEQLPWLSVAYFGPNEVAVHVVDTNLYDLFRSQQVQQLGFVGFGGIGLAPGEIPNLIEHVEGGTGIFGSFAKATQRVSIQPQSGNE